MLDIDASIKQIRRNGHRLDVFGPASEQALAQLEAALGVNLPPSYRRFVMKYGGLQRYDSIVSGILGDNGADALGGFMYGDTLAMREELALPKEFLVIQPDGEAPYCFDSKQVLPNGEMPVVCVTCEFKPGGINHTPTVIAKDFEDWLERFFFFGWIDDDIRTPWQRLWGYFHDVATRALRLLHLSK